MGINDGCDITGDVFVVIYIQDRKLKDTKQWITHPSKEGELQRR
jgi:hypothetical protein